MTEREMVDRLRARYEGESGNGPAGALIPGVRDAAGFDAKRTIDALGFHFWPSRGLLIDAYECKSSRSDWLREVETPAKADRFCALADRFYVVAGRADIVKVDEVPPDWGLLVPHGDKLKEVKPAAVLHADSPAIAEWAGRAHRAASGAGLARCRPASTARSWSPSSGRRRRSTTCAASCALHVMTGTARASHPASGRRCASLSGYARSRRRPRVRAGARLPDQGPAPTPLAARLQGHHARRHRADAAHDPGRRRERAGIAQPPGCGGRPRRAAGH
jgi:hypothetical protein